MTHLQIQENSIADRYVMKKLSVEERSSFEEHLVDCQECLDRVETLTLFRRGLRAVASRESAPGYALGEIGLLAWFGHLTRYRQAALTAGALLLLLGPAVLLYITQVRGTRKELRRTQAAYADLLQRYSQHPHAVNKPEEHLPVADQQHQAIAAGVDHEHSGGDQTAMPSTSLPMFTLSMVREAPDQSVPGNQVRYPSSSAGVILSLEFEPVPEPQSYRAKLYNNRRVVWSAQKLTVSGTDSIAIILSTRLLTAGDYMLQLEGCSRSGVCYQSAKYSFRVTTTK